MAVACAVQEPVPRDERALLFATHERDHINRRRSSAVRQSVLEAIKAGIWDFEPDVADADEFEATDALPGTDEKIKILARRAESGLPLWHPKDRRTYDDRPSL